MKYQISKKIKKKNQMNFSIKIIIIRILSNIYNNLNKFYLQVYIFLIFNC